MNSKELITFKGSGYWHEAKKWSGGKVPTINDNVLLSYHTGDIMIGYDENSLEYKLRKLIDIITLGLTNILVYHIYYKEMIIDLSLIGSSITFKEGKIKTNTVFTYKQGPINTKI